MNTLLTTNFLQNNNTRLNSIKFVSISRQALSSNLPNDISFLKQVKLFDSIHTNSNPNTIQGIHKPLQSLSLFKEYSLINFNSSSHYSSKIQSEKNTNDNKDIEIDQDKDQDSINREKEAISGDEDSHSNCKEKENTNKRNQTSNNISLQDFNQIKTELDIQMKKTEDLNKKFAQLRKAYLDNLSEYDLIKNRQQREIKVIKEYAIGNFAKDLIDVHDNFLRAFEIVKEFDKAKTNENEKRKEEMFKSFIEGIQMVKTSLSKTFSKHGLIEYTPKIKDKFNPNYHEAIYDYEDSLLDPGSIGKVMCSGFKLGNRIIRPSKVGIIKKKAH